LQQRTYVNILERGRGSGNVGGRVELLGVDWAAQLRSALLESEYTQLCARSPANSP
jgi:hypothetical protein